MIKKYEMRFKQFFHEPFIPHIQFSVREFFLYIFLFLATSMFYAFFFYSSTLPAPVSKRDDEKRDAIKMKLVPKKEPKAQFYVRQPCRMCI